MSEQHPEGVYTPQELHEHRLEDAATDVEREAVEQSGTQPSKTVPIELPTGATVNVPMMSEWRQSALTAMQAGDFDTWAELVLPESDWDAWDEWRAEDPRLGESQDFFARVGKATGEAASGNRALRRSLRRTRTR